MKTKKQYIAPTLKCVEFKVERGYAMSQGLNDWHNKPDGLYLDNFETYGEGGFSSDGPHGGFFSGDNSDWD